jgi:hypothetical protein
VLGQTEGFRFPFNPSFIFTSKDCGVGEDEKKGEDSRWYRSVLMSISYLANWTRPDVAFAVSKLARFMQTPGQKHAKELKRVLRYLRCNQDRGLAMDFSKKPAKEPVRVFRRKLCRLRTLEDPLLLLCSSIVVLLFLAHKVVYLCYYLH